MKVSTRNSRPRMPVYQRLFRKHVLSAKIAGVSSMVSLLIGIVFLAVTGWASATYILVLILVTLLATYLSAHFFLSERIDLARATLRRSRKYKFQKLNEADFPKGDELNELIRQVYRTGQVLEREIRQLRRVANYRRAFVGDVSHELKTPIFAIQGYAETLLDGALDDTDVRRKFVQKIINNAERLGNLTADLTEISRIETGELKMAFTDFPIDDLVREIVESLEPIAAKRRVQIRCVLPDNLPHVLGDELRIRQVIVNLLDNAIKYSDKDDTVDIRVELADKNDVSISVVDSGIGIDKKNIPRITERFYRVDKSRSRSAGGTGLGLAIVKHILKAHNQKLQVSSTPDVGSTFRFELPIAETSSAEKTPS